MFDALAGALAFFYDLWPSYGGAIILLTLAIMLVLSPLSIKATRSMLAMSRLQPEIKKLQAKHKDDRQKLNEEMLAFYQQHKINPFSSCLPLLLQMPIFLILYRVLSGLNKVDGGNGGGPSYLSQGSQLYQDLKATIPTGAPGAIEMEWLGLDLSHSLTSELSSGGVVGAIPYFLLVALVAATGYIQQRQISSRSSSTVVNPQQQMITRLMPGLMAVISISIPAALVLYFVVSNCVRIAQQALVTRMEGGPDADTASAPARPNPASGGRPGLLGRLGRGGGTTGGSAGTPPERPAPSARARPAPSARSGATPASSRPASSRPGPSRRPSPPSPSAPTPARPVAGGSARNRKKRRK